MTVNPPETVEQAARTLYEKYARDNGVEYEWRSYPSSWWDMWVEQAQALRGISEEDSDGTRD